LNITVLQIIYHKRHTFHVLKSPVHF